VHPNKQNNHYNNDPSVDLSSCIFKSKQQLYWGVGRTHDSFGVGSLASIPSNVIDGKIQTEQNYNP